jgi:undecaprenyl-phosphate galactose phosphotransferase
MCQDADEMLDQMTQEEKVNYYKDVKLKDDKRVTRVGKVIRRTSIDELPQLINVVLGDMSVVGPRPPLALEEEMFGNTLKKIMVTRPGISGPWQVNGRNNIPFEKRIVLNENYVDNFGAKQDSLILFKTISVVFSTKGAA